MDAATLAKEVLRLLVPALPYLHVVGSKALEGAGAKLGEDAWNRSKAMWSGLKDKLFAQDDAKDAITDLVAEPDDSGARQALNYKLRKIFERDPSLAMQISELVGGPRAVQEISLVRSEADGLQQESSSSNGRTQQSINGWDSKLKNVVQKAD